MVHWGLIVAHAALAVLAFGLGCSLLVTLPQGPRSGRFVGYAGCVWLAMLALIVVVAVDWTDLPTRKRIAFGILCVLAVYLVVRTEQARRTLTARAPRWRERLVGHVGFVLISLFDGFCIVLAIDLGLPGFVIVIAALFGVAAGVVAIRAVAKRETAGDVARSAAPQDEDPREAI
jgi:hypothetical protein